MLLVIQTMTYSEKVPVMVWSKIIDRAMGMITKGELVRATVTWKQAHLMGGYVWVTPAAIQKCKGEQGAMKGLPPPSLPILPHLRNSLLTMSRGMSTPHGESPFPQLGLSTYMATQTSEGVACRSTCLLSQQHAPSCPLL